MRSYKSEKNIAKLDPINLPQIKLIPDYKESFVRHPSLNMI